MLKKIVVVMMVLFMVVGGFAKDENKAEKAKPEKKKVEQVQSFTNEQYLALSELADNIIKAKNIEKELKAKEEELKNLQAKGQKDLNKITRVRMVKGKKETYVNPKDILDFEYKYGRDIAYAKAVIYEFKKELEGLKVKYLWK